MPGMSRKMLATATPSPVRIDTHITEASRLRPNCSDASGSTARPM